jgi:hypothetical protein
LNIKIFPPNTNFHFGDSSSSYSNRLSNNDSLSSPYSTANTPQLSSNLISKELQDISTNLDKNKPKSSSESSEKVNIIKPIDNWYVLIYPALKMVELEFEYGDNTHPQLIFEYELERIDANEPLVKGVVIKDEKGTFVSNLELEEGVYKLHVKAVNSSSGETLDDKTIEFQVVNIHEFIGGMDDSMGVWGALNLIVCQITYYNSANRNLVSWIDVIIALSLAAGGFAFKALVVPLIKKDSSLSFDWLLGAGIISIINGFAVLIASLTSTSTTRLDFLHFDIAHTVFNTLLNALDTVSDIFSFNFLGDDIFNDWPLRIIDDTVMFGITALIWGISLKGVHLMPKNEPSWRRNSLILTFGSFATGIIFLWLYYQYRARYLME